MGRMSVDVGTLDLGVNSAWTHGDEVTAGVEWSLSQRAKPPTSDQLSSDSWLGGLGAPSKSSFSAPGISDDGAGSAPMSISPILGSVVGLHTSCIVVGETNKIVATSTDDEINTMPLAHMSWFDLPDDDELGEVPEFPVLNPSICALESTPRIIEELPITLNENEQTLGNEKTHRIARTEQWAADVNRQGDPISKGACGLGDVPIEGQSLLVDSLQDKIRQLENLIVESQLREEKTHCQLLEAYRAPTINTKRPSVRLQTKAIETHVKADPSPPVRLKPVESSWFQRASSILPSGSSIKHTMVGGTPKDLDPSKSPLDESSGDYSSAESEDENKYCKEKGKTHEVRANHSNNNFGLDFLALEPESDHESDSPETKQSKHIACHEYHARLNLLKYQQSFIKNEPPFMYNSEANATTFKKWVREVWEWKDHTRLTTNQSLRMLGKYLGGQAYRFFESNVLDLQKDYSLTEFFEQLFDYVFPPDIQMLQRQKFLVRD